MQQKPADELLGAERHEFGLSTLPIILPAKADAALLEVDEPAVGDRHAMRVAPEISERLLGTAERTLGVHNPIRSAQRGQVLREGVWIGEHCQRSKELQAAGFECGSDLLDEQVAEQGREHLYVQ